MRIRNFGVVAVLAVAVTAACAAKTIDRAAPGEGSRAQRAVTDESQIERVLRNSLERVIPPKTPASGVLRKAGIADLPLTIEWGGGFGRDAHIKNFDPAPQSERLIRSGSLYLWEDGEPRSMAAAVGPTPNGIRVGYVYTPPSFRGRGYATATVASLSRLLLDEGRRFCFLFTDLANPISNAIYQGIGYQAVADVLDVYFC